MSRNITTKLLEMMGPGKNPDTRMAALRKLGSNHETFKKMIGEDVESLDEATTGATKLVHTRTGADGAKYHIMQDSPSDFSIYRIHNGKTKHIDTYGSLHRAKSVLDNEVKEETELDEGNAENKEKKNDHFDKMGANDVT